MLLQARIKGSIPWFPVILLIAKDITLKDSSRFTTAFATTVQWLSRGEVDPVPLFSGEYASDKIDTALIFASDKSQATKVQLTF